MPLKHPWKWYDRTNKAIMRPYVDGEDMSGISVSREDTPGPGGMIAINPINDADQWYVAAEYFQANFTRSQTEPRDG